jgi:SagB-type dehydrogenase family enzyme
MKNQIKGDSKIELLKPFSDLEKQAGVSNKEEWFYEMLKNRKTVREFSAKELDLKTLSDLLWSAFGINREVEGKRTAPSAVNWQEIGIYVALKDGLFYYDGQKHELIKKLDRDLRDKCGMQPFLKDASLVLIFVADFSKMTGEVAQSPGKKEFYSAVDTGFISQNVYLFCSFKKLSTIVLGRVDKESLAKAMNLNENQKVILTQPVG